MTREADDRAPGPAGDAAGNLAPGPAGDAGDAPRLAAEYRVRFDEGAPDGLVRGSALVGIVQDMAWRHSDALGLTREWYAARGVLWLVRAVQVETLLAIAHGDVVRVETRLVGVRRVTARRETLVTAADGRLAAVVRTDWALVDTDGRPARIVEGIVALYPGAPTFDPIRVERGDPPAGAVPVAMRVRPRDLDPLGHVNNGVYVDLLEESIEAAGGAPRAALPRRASLEYVDAATHGEALVARAWRTADGWVHRLERERDGATLVRGSLVEGDRAVG